MTNPDDPPFPPSKYVARMASFNDPANPKRRLFGHVETAAYIGRIARGAIPDYQLNIRGASGKILMVSLVENQVSFKDDTP